MASKDAEPSGKISSGLLLLHNSVKSIISSLEDDSSPPVWTVVQEVSNPGAHEVIYVRVNQILVKDVRAVDVKLWAVINKKGALILFKATGATLEVQFTMSPNSSQYGEQFSSVFILFILFNWHISVRYWHISSGSNCQSNWRNKRHSHSRTGHHGKPTGSLEDGFFLFWLVCHLWM